MLLIIKIPLRYCYGTYYHVKLAAFAVCRCQATNVINSLAQNFVLNNKPYLKSAPKGKTFFACAYFGKFNF